MFSTPVNKPSPLEIYNVILTQFQSIKNTNYFVNYTAIPPGELLGMSNTVAESIEKLGELSSIYVKKHNDGVTSVSTIEKMKCMYDLHNELLTQLHNFGKISSYVVDGIRDITANSMSNDLISYIHYDIINRHKLIILQIFDTIKKINVYCAIMKDKFA
jgi:hypothetical protein